MPRVVLLIALFVVAVIPSASADDADGIQLTTARRLNPPLKVLPIALGTPLAVAGVSIAYSSPIAWVEGDLLGWNLLRTVGLGVMGGGLGTGITLNVVARSVRFLGGGKFQHRLGFLIAGPALAGAGYAITVAATSATVLANTPLAVATSIGGGALWGTGMLMLIVDAATTAFENDSILASGWRPGRVQLAGWALAPSASGGGLTGGVTFRF